MTAADNTEPMTKALRKIAESVGDSMVSSVETNLEGDPANLVDALFAIAAAMISSAHLLGNGNASTPMGALENLAKQIHDGSTRIADSIGDLAEAIREHGRGE